MLPLSMNKCLLHTSFFLSLGLLLTSESPLSLVSISVAKHPHIQQGKKTEPQAGHYTLTHTPTNKDVQNKSDDARDAHAEHCLEPVSSAVDQHQPHILEVAHWAGEELHK